MAARTRNASWMEDLDLKEELQKYVRQTLKGDGILNFIKSILKSLVILAIWLAGSQGCDLFTNRTIFCFKSHLFLANENGTVNQNSQSDFKVRLMEPIQFQENERQKVTVLRIWQLQVIAKTFLL